MRLLLVFSLAFCIYAVPPRAAAVDGVTEFNPLCATSGCFAGDSPGFPVTITESGSYRLTGNLDVSALSTPENRTAIEISEDFVTLDLNGFTIQGPVTCSGTPVTSCTPGSGTGVGVSASGTGREVLIKNGHIRGMGLAGVSCTQGCRVQDIVASENRLIGITNANEDGYFANNIARRNGDYGFFVAGQIQGNIATGNGGIGIFVNPHSRVVGNQVIENGGNGVRCFTCVLLDNIIDLNTGFGVDFGGRPIYGRNLINDNSAGELSGSAFAVDANRCGSVACP